MVAAAARTLLWPLLLLPLSLAAAPTPQSAGPGLPQPPREARGSPGAQAAGRPLASAVGAQGSPRDDIGRVCGKPKVMGKIYGGQDADAGLWPWQASVLYKGSHFCGAVLIDSHWLVSAAHCFIKKSQALEDYQVLLGYTQLYRQTQHTQKMSVSRIITHPDFEKLHPFGSDIAMLQLYLPVNFTVYIVPVCLPSPDMQLPSDVSCWITGWGMLTEDVRLSPPFNLQEGKVVLIENMFCNFLYGQIDGKGNNYSVHEDMVCAGDFSTGKSICQGDSGGPLVCYVPNAWVLVGLASWGLDCRHPAYPSIFTRVTYFANWINEIKRLTPLPVTVPAPSLTGSQSQHLRAAGPPGPSTALVPPQTWLLLPFTLRA
ncbi:putative serine protease 47 isoform X2 [Microcebus murinus]|uniref:putative serine protease 47 isoform X2 n=1 Tax=Microcebus murinus TaxID=30608 RepID=UPI000643337D|nr:putative serine protease 47 isoform X2 [Microcebus murinus]